jgi:hypothetical protein
MLDYRMVLCTCGRNEIKLVKTENQQKLKVNFKARRTSESTEWKENNGKHSLHQFYHSYNRQISFAIKEWCAFARAMCFRWLYFFIFLVFAI